jgi:hypothetical protein
MTKITGFLAGLFPIVERLSLLDRLSGHQIIEFTLPLRRYDTRTD